MMAIDVSEIKFRLAAYKAYKELCEKRMANIAKIWRSMGIEDIAQAEKRLCFLRMNELVDFTRQDDDSVV